VLSGGQTNIIAFLATVKKNKKISRWPLFNSTEAVFMMGQELWKKSYRILKLVVLDGV